MYLLASDVVGLHSDGDVVNSVLNLSGGWDRDTSKISEDIKTEIDQAFENVDVTIKAAGGKGWSQVRYTSTLAPRLAA